MKAQAKQLAELLKILGNENRLLILCELANGAKNVGTLLDKLDISQSGLSQHLAILKANGILDYNKEAQTVVYSVKDKRIYKLLEVLKATYCTKEV